MINFRIVMKIIGAVLVLWSAIQIGRDIIKKSEGREKELKDILFSSEIIFGELRFANSSLPEIFEETEKKSQGVIKDMFSLLVKLVNQEECLGFENIWKEIVLYLGKNSEMTKPQQETFGKLGEILGYQDRESQLDKLKLWQEEIKYEYTTTREKNLKIRKLSASLSILFGIAIVIIFL